MEPGPSEILTVWKKPEITHHLGIMQHSGDRVLGKQMVPKRNRHGQSRDWMCLGSRRLVLMGFGRPDDQSM